MPVALIAAGTPPAPAETGDFSGGVGSPSTDSGSQEAGEIRDTKYICIGTRSCCCCGVCLGAGEILQGRYRYATHMSQVTLRALVFLNSWHSGTANLQGVPRARLLLWTAKSKSRFISQMKY